MLINFKPTFFCILYFNYDIFIILGTLIKKHGNQMRNNKYRTLCFNEVDSDEVCLLTWAPLGMVYFILKIIL